MQFSFDTKDWDKDLHLYTYKELNILLDINSGAVHLVDDLTKDVINSLIQHNGEALQVLAKLKSTYSEEEIVEVLAELKSLEEEGLLFTQEEITAPWTAEEKIIKSLCLHVAHDCNLRCRYCFAGTGEFNGPRGLMELEVGKAALDFLLANSGSRPTVEVDFFGGEPLMNMPVVRELVFYGEEAAAKAGKTIEFTLTTNGMLLDDEISSFLKEHKVNLVLSIDGRREVNDYMRPMAGGQGSYERIVPRYRQLVQALKPTDYYIRGTYTRYNLDFAEDVRHLHDLGFTSLSVEPVVAAPEEDYAFQPEDLPRISQEYDRLVDLYLERKEAGNGFDFFHFNVDLEQGPCLPKRLTGCGAGFEYLAVTPEGELYPCHQFVGRTEYKLGDVWQGLVNEAVSRRFRDAHIYNKETCSKCWARFLCSGGCHANADAHNGTLLEPYEMGCRLQQKRLECAIYLECVKRMAGKKQ
jgi:uncharacterized protein